MAIKIQESGVRSQESEVRSQKPEERRKKKEERIRVAFGFRPRGYSAILPNPVIGSSLIAFRLLTPDSCLF
jgi:hypothetical protein